MNIRKATIEDIDDIMKVEWASFIDNIQEEQSVFEERIKRCPELFLIFQEGENVAGYMSAEFMDKVPETAEELKLGHIPSFSKNNKDSYIYISSFAILPEFRGAGAGSLMWNKSLEYFKKKCGCEKFLLLVNEEWKGAFHIYEKSGFKIVKEFPAFFDKDDGGKSTGILMSLK